MSNVTRIKLLPYGRNRPRRIRGQPVIHFRRAGPGAGKLSTTLLLPCELQWPEVEAVRRRMRTMPADTPLAALQTQAMAACLPLMLERMLRADGAPPEVVRMARSSTCTPEYGAAPPEQGDDGRLTRFVETGRWVRPDGTVITVDVPSDAPPGFIMLLEEQETPLAH